MKNGIGVKFHVGRKQWNNCVLGITSDMGLTSFSMGSNELLSCINKAFMI